MPDLKATLRRVPEEALNQGNLEIVEEVFSPEYVMHDPSSPTEIRGLEGIRQYLENFRTAFPDLHLTVESQVAEGDTVMTRWTATGTHQGEAMGMQPTGNRVTVQGIIESRFSEGKVVEEWQSLDTLALMQGIGAVAPPATPT